MKNGILYGGVFLFAFILVTGAIIYLNSSYENIFEFNFNPKSEIEQKVDSSKSKITNVKENKTENQKKPPIKNQVKTSQELVQKNPEQNIQKIDTVKNQQTDIKEVKPDTSATETQPVKNEIKIPQEDLTNIVKKNQEDEEYSEWLKKVTGIYESLDPGKAAKIIQTYSDNVARDILYSMKKKTAAKIVAQLSPETTNRIFRFE
jgi:flagellar motility protein MotE (MotC chaperone)